MLRFGGCSNTNSCTIVLRGSNQQILDEAERSVHDAVCVLSQFIRDPRFLWGGGYTDIRTSLELEQFSKQYTGKISLVILSFSRAIQNLFKILLDNADLDSVNFISQIRARYENNSEKFSIDIRKEILAHSDKVGLIELFKLKTQMIISAVETVEMILRIDKILS